MFFSYSVPPLCEMYIGTSGTPESPDSKTGHADTAIRITLAYYITKKRFCQAI